MKNQLYEINVNGIKCVGCKNKIEKQLANFDSVKFVNINVVLNQIIVEVDSAINTIDDITDLLTKMKFDVLSCNQIQEHSQQRRTMTFISYVQKIEIDKIKELENLKGIEKVIIVDKKINKYKGYELKITYNPLLIKALQLNNKIKEDFQEYDFQYKNELQNVLSSLMQENKQYSNKEMICIIIFLVLIFLDLFFNFIFKLHNIYIFSHKFNLYLITTTILCLLVILYFGIPIYRDSIKVYSSFRILNMNTLVTVSSFASFVYIFILFVQYIEYKGDQLDDYLLELVRAIETPSIFITIVLIGKYIEEMAKNNIRNKTFEFNEHFYDEIAHKLTYINPKNRKMAVLSEEEINQGILEKDDLFRVQKDDYLLCDSIIMQGQVKINQNDNFGHQIEIIKKEGDNIRSGSFVMSEEGAILKVENNLEQSFLYKLVKEMSNSLGQKFQYYNLVDRFIKYFIPFICLFACFTFFFWILISFIKRNSQHINFNFIIQRTISILVVSCPCAFGLAIPMITAIVLNQALKNGILIKNVEKIASLRNAQHIIFDKNGTLTEDCNEITLIQDNSKDISYYQILLQLEKDQKHKIAQLIYSFCQQKLSNEKIIVNSFNLEKKEIYQNGIKAQTSVNDLIKEIMIGNYAFYIKNDNQKIIQQIQNYHQETQNSHSSFIYCFIENKMSFVFQMVKFDTLRQEAIELINKLNNSFKKDLYILSGDQKESVLDIARKVNIKEINCFYEIDSQSKKQTIQRLKQRGEVIMIGDGLNDILSLSEADYGISFNASSNLNLISSDFIFLTKNLKLYLSLLKISKITFYFTWINIFWAFIYNIIMIPFAGGYFYFITDFQLTPAYSSFAMLLSSILIILTSFSIKLFDLDYEKIQIIQFFIQLFQKILTINRKMIQLQNNKFFNDERFGEIQIASFKDDPQQLLMVKREYFKNIEQFKLRKKQIEQRSKFDCENILQIQYFDFDQKKLEASVYFDFYEQSIDLKVMNNLDCIFLFKDILNSILYLFQKKMIHGDIRPENIAYNDITQKFVLLDRLNDTLPPLQRQILNIDNQKDLFMAPKIFNALVEGQNKIKQHAFKSELFSLGLVCLSVFGMNDQIQNLYSIDEKIFRFDLLQQIFDCLNKKILNTQIQEFLIFLQNYILVREDIQISPRKVNEKIQSFRNLRVYFNEQDEFSDSKMMNYKEKKSYTNVQNMTFKDSLNSTQSEINFYNPLNYQNPVKEIFENNYQSKTYDKINIDDKNKVKLNNDFYIDKSAQDLIVVDHNSHENIQNFKKTQKETKFNISNNDQIKKINFLKINFQPYSENPSNILENQCQVMSDVFRQQINYDNDTVPVDMQSASDSVEMQTSNSSVKTYKKKTTLNQNDQDYKVYLSSIGVEFGEQEKQDEVNIKQDQNVLLKDSAFLRDSNDLFDKKKLTQNLLKPKKEKLKQFLQRKSISRSSITDRDDQSLQNSIEQNNFIALRSQNLKIEEPLIYFQSTTQQKLNQKKFSIQDSSVPFQLQYKSENNSLQKLNPFQCSQDFLEDYNPRQFIQDSPLPLQEPEKQDKGKIDIPMNLILRDIYLQIKLKKYEFQPHKNQFKLNLDKVHQMNDNSNDSFTSQQSLECEEHKRNQIRKTKTKPIPEYQFQNQRQLQLQENLKSKTPSKDVNQRRKFNYSKSKSRNKTLQKKKYFKQTFYEIKKKHKLNKSKNIQGSELEDLRQKIQANILESQRLQQQLELISCNSQNMDNDQQYERMINTKPVQKFQNNIDLSQKYRPSHIEEGSMSSRQFRESNKKSKVKSKTDLEE